MRRLNRLFAAIAILLVALILSASTLLAAPSSQEEENKAFIRRSAEELWNKGNLAIADEVFATDFVNHNPVAPDVRSLEDFKQWATAIRTAFTDYHVTIEDMIAEGDKVVVRWTSRGTHKGTGAQMTLPGTTTYRIAGNKIVEAWWNYDHLAFYQQLGLLPSLEQALEERANEAIVRRLVEVCNEGNLDAMEEMAAPDFVLHDPLTPEDIHGPEGFRQFYAGILSAMPDAHLSIEHLIPEGDLVAIHLSSRGTFTNEWMGIPPTGEEVTFPLINIWRIAEGKIVEGWLSYDTLGFMQQLGVVPPPGGGE